jgi:cytochrome c peroxidase
MAGDRLRAGHFIEEEPGLRSAYESVFGPLPDLSNRERFPAEAHPVPGKPDDPRSVAWSALQEDDRAAIDRIFANVGKAIAAYERRLVSRRAPFDRFVDALRAGRDEPAFSKSARRGLQTFVGRGRCRICHSGANFTDGEFHNTGVPPLDAAGRADSGRHAGIALLLASPFNLQGRLSDDRSERAGELLRFVRRTPETWGQFKTPSLRNVAQSAPYMHQGQLATLRDVLRFYSTQAGTVDPGANGERILKPLHLSERELDDLTAFLESLTDEAIDPELLRAPGAPEPGDGLVRPR